MRRLLLWDIDGTLIHGGGVGSAALEQAVRAVGELTHVPKVDMHGKTDPQILREIFEAAEVDQARIDSLVDEAMRAAEAELKAAEAELRRLGGVHVGVREVLTVLGSTSGVRQTLVTGNLVGNAAVKLGAFDLAHFFDDEIGAYGTDHADRLELVPIALERASRLRGEVYDGNDVWVLGDTPNDLACARAGGVRCLLVGTGIGYERVRDLDADVVFADLSDTDAVVRALLD